MIHRLLLSAALATLMASQASATLRHLYTFNDGTANDSQGSAHGTLMGGATITGGEVMLAGGPVNTPDTSANNMGPHVDLNGPAIGVNTFPELSLELWLKSSPANVSPTVNFTMAAVLGRHTLNTGGNEQPWSGHDYLMMQPTRGGGPAAMRVAITNDRFEAEAGVNGGAQLADGLLHQMVATVNTTTLSFYLDGVLVGSTPLGDKSISQLANDVAYLGRAVYNDPFFAGSVDEFRIYDHALPLSEVQSRFNTGPDGTGSPAVPMLTIDRATGAMTLTKQGAPYDMFKYTINSPSGALDPTKWQTIADNRDADSGASFDQDDNWAILSATNNSLSEEDPVDGIGFNDGGRLGAGATTSLPLLSNGGWIRTYREDVTMTLEILVGGTPTVTPVNISYTGNGGQAYMRSDFNFDNALTAADYNVLLDNFLKPLSEATAALAYGKGDINGDLRNDANDFRLFKADYIAANGEAAFAALMATVPEPGGALMLLTGSALVTLQRRRGVPLLGRPAVRSWYTAPAAGLASSGTH
ncbi:MAG TPA: LamG domain-containing protein [Lacipirellula sp.]